MSILDLAPTESLPLRCSAMKHFPLTKIKWQHKKGFIPSSNFHILNIFLGTLVSGEYFQ